MADQLREEQHRDPNGGGKPGRGRVNLIGVLIALVFLTVAVVGFTGDPFWLFEEGTKWAAVGILGLIGLGLVATSLPGLRKR